MGRLWACVKGARQTCSFAYDAAWLGLAGAFALDLGAEGFQGAVARPVPPLVALPKLLGAARHVLDEKETDGDLRLLLAPGSSLGGARPKASVLGADGRLLLMAKFPSQTDDWPVPTWEAVAMTLAERAGVTVPAFELRQDGVDAPGDAAHLWRRMVFNILISNTDDHLRNHGFLREPGGWRLSPAYDLNPMPVDVKSRVHALAVNAGDQHASLDTGSRLARG